MFITYSLTHPIDFLKNSNIIIKLSEHLNKID